MMNKTIAHLGVKAGLLNYHEHETPRDYFMSAWANEEDVVTFTELLIEKCICIMKENEMMPVGFIQPKSADLHSTMIRAHFGIEK
jgi:hypothetical protein